MDELLVRVCRSLGVDASDAVRVELAAADRARLARRVGS